MVHGKSENHMDDARKGVAPWPRKPPHDDKQEQELHGISSFWGRRDEVFFTH
jgi:hypothetical protein